MKTYVITDAHGNVVGSARIEESKSPDVPSGAKPVPNMPGHQVHEVDLPKELHGVKSADELHQHLAKLIKDKK
jgi:hypothetical protein